MRMEWQVKVFQKNNLGQIQTSTKQFLQAIEDSGGRLWEVDFFSQDSNFCSSIIYLAEGEVEEEGEEE